MNKREFLTKSANGAEVYFDPVDSHTATHFADCPPLRGLAKEIIEKTVLDQEYMGFDTDMGRIVGNTDAVENDPGDEIVYAKRMKRDVYTSFNKSKLSQPCSVVAMALGRENDGSYNLLSTWIGSIDSPPFPGDKDETPESKPYWMSHSLVWGSQAIQPGTETTECPW